MSKNTGKEYEEFVHDIYNELTRNEKFTTVQLDAQLDSEDGPRQIDILLRSKVANANLTIIVECRDYSKRLDITHLDSFRSKLIDVNASKGILVSRKGFSKKAISKANRVGIQLCLASDLGALLNTLKLEIPIRANLIRSTYDATFSISVVKNGQAVSAKKFHYRLLEQLHFELIHGIIPLPYKSTEHDWTPTNTSTPYSLIDTDNNPVSVTDLRLREKYQVSYFFGYLNDLSGIQSIHNLESGETTLIIGIEDATEIIPSLTHFRVETDIPTSKMLTLNLIEVINPETKKPHHITLKTKPNHAH